MKELEELAEKIANILDEIDELRARIERLEMR